MSIDDEWNDFLENCNDDNIIQPIKSENTVQTTRLDQNELQPSDLYISTKTEILYLSKEIDLGEVFWKIPLINYDEPIEGIVKKQMKFISNTSAQFDELKERLKAYEKFYVEEMVISEIKNEIGDKRYKDVRKISIGVTCKDMKTARVKRRGAFYNCFVIIVRINEDGRFKEYHIKVFNTGKIELPGIQNNEGLERIKQKVMWILNDCIQLDTTFNEELSNNDESILINSNFDCGYYLDREKLFNILQYEYNLNTSYDSCTYPGVRCKFYYDTKQVTNGIQGKNTSKSISFMVFRTGSVLIVGKCNEDELKCIYEFIKNILIKEYLRIVVDTIEKKKKEQPEKKVKKTITIIKV